MDADRESRTARECDILIADVEWSVDAVESLIERILDAMDADQISSKTAKAKLEPLQVLRRKLLGLACHPSAIRRAAAVWPAISRDLPPEEEIDDQPAIAYHGSSAADF
tara:strand:+ start:408 stop:734 length:327 start_codon:yes stop_codon:yes gene_type:complete